MYENENFDLPFSSRKVVAHFSLNFLIFMNYRMRRGEIISYVCKMFLGPGKNNYKCEMRLCNIFLGEREMFNN